MGKDINVSIVLYNSDFTKIAALVKELHICNHINQIYLIDNSPTYNSLFEIDNVNYIFTGKNLGYGAGHNIAIQKSIEDHTKYHLVLNPDILIENIVLNKLLIYLEINKDIGLIMPNIKYPDGKTQHLCKLLASPIDLLFRRFIPFEEWIKPRNNKYELRFTGYDQIMEVPSLSGCFMMMRTDILEKIEGFDERFFMYCEDLDLCRRIGQISKTIFNPEVSIIHNYEKGSYNISKLFFYHIHSAIKYFNKWGWFFDKERKLINKHTLDRLQYNNNS